MAYTPTVWVTGDIITAEKLNKAEQGIKENSLKIPYISYFDVGNQSAWLGFAYDTEAETTKLEVLSETITITDFRQTVIFVYEGENITLDLDGVKSAQFKVNDTMYDAVWDDATTSYVADVDGLDYAIIFDGNNAYFCVYENGAVKAGTYDANFYVDVYQGKLVVVNGG